MPIISTIDAETLVNQGLLSPANSDGVRRIHKRRLNRSSDEENQHLPLSPVSTISSSSQSDSDLYTTIPEELVSLATIKYLGYNDQMAAQIWSKWTAQAPGIPVPESISLGPFELRFIQHIVGYSFGHRGDLDSDTDSDDDAKWNEVMDRSGINNETQRAIMDPVFRQVRLTESCQFWIQDTVEMRYEVLQEVQAASREREQMIQRAASRPGGSASHGTSRGGASSRSVSETLRTTPGFSPHTAMSEAALSATNAPGSITLYRGMKKSLLDDLFDSSGNLDNIRTLSSLPQTDFSGNLNAYYFAVDRDVAIHYASYTKRRGEGCPVVLVHATFKNSTIESLPETKLQRLYWPSEDWKRLVFLSRKNRKIPSELRKFNQAALIIGTIAGKPNSVYARLNHHTEITGEFVFKNSAGRNAIQYVFLNPDGEELMEKAELKVFPLTSAEFNKWHRESRQSP
ncbi:hypothetical protein GGI42DRAFT_310010 [Trichoderma sp. SZMC 28013]